MSPLRRESVGMVLGVVVACFFGSAWARAQGLFKKPERQKWLVDRALVVSPAAQPIPALRYRLLPLESELKEGNAVPIYLRLMFERNDAWKRMLIDQPAKWNALPLDKLPREQVQQFLKGFHTFIEQIELGARLKHADWNYTIDQGDVISVLLPDAQTMRTYAPVLVLKARFELAQGQFEQAAHTCETGLAFGRHVADGPFLINQLVGIAIVRQFLGALTDLIGTPNSPNLYWSLSVLPRPLVSLRKGFDFEQRTLVMEFPELAHLDRARTPQQWQALLNKIRTIVQGLNEPGPNAPKQEPKPPEPAERSPDLPTAKHYLTDRLRVPAAQVNAMAPAHVLLLWLVNASGDYRDDVFKGCYLPYPDGQKVALDAMRRLEQAPQTEATHLARAFLPSVRVNMAQNRLMREVAALRVIEAIRMYAAAHDGQLPEKLNDIHEAPVPKDPGTDRPFEYHTEGQSAILSSRIPDESTNVSGLRYRVTIRKRSASQTR